MAIPLEGTISVTGPTGTLLSPYSRSDLLTTTCLNTGTARAFLVERAHLFIHQDTTDPTRPRPFLMLDQGLDIAGPGGAPPDGVLDDNDLVPIASDIEDLQIAYILDQINILQSGAGLAASAAAYVLDSNANGIWGETPNVREQLTGNSAATAPYNLAGSFTAANGVIGVGAGGAPCGTSSLNPYRQPCLFDKSSLEITGVMVHPYRWTAWNANISQVRLNVIARSAISTAISTGLTAQSTEIHYLSPLENRARVDLLAAPGWYGTTSALNFQRTYFNGAVRPINLATTGLFLY